MFEAHGFEHLWRHQGVFCIKGRATHSYPKLGISTADQCPHVLSTGVVCNVLRIWTTDAGQDCGQMKFLPHSIPNIIIISIVIIICYFCYIYLLLLLLLLLLVIFIIVYYLYYY